MKLVGIYWEGDRDYNQTVRFSTVPQSRCPIITAQDEIDAMMKYFEYTKREPTAFQLERMAWLQAIAKS